MSSVAQLALGDQVDRGRPATEVAVHHVGPLEPESSSRVSPSRTTSWSASRKPVGVRRVTSSMTPSTATTGVGRIAVSPVWL